MLLVLFLSIVAGSLFPLRLLDSGWQLRLGSTLINSAPLPLTALALLQLAAFLDPGDPQLQARSQLAAALAIPVALGYLMLVPLVGSAAVRQQANSSMPRSADLNRTTTQLEILRQAVRSASSVEQLNQRLQALQGPQLESADRRLSLPLVRARVNAVLDQSAAQIARARAASPPGIPPWTLLPEILRTTMACLALSVGFAGLGRRPQAQVSFLTDVITSWQRWRSGQSPRAISQHEQLKSLAPDEPPEP